MEYRQIQGGDMKHTDITFADQVMISRKLKKIAKMVDRELEKACGKRVPFSLFTWGGLRSQYVSNTDRDQAMIAMGETIERWCADEDDGPPHKAQS
jgi:hypothetical protein